MSIQDVTELKLGPVETPRDYRIAFEELQRKLNEMLRALKNPT